MMRLVDQYAELLSQDLPQQEIMRRMNISANACKMHMRKIRQELGWQAS